MIKSGHVRTAAGVPIAVRPAIAVGVVVLTWAQLWLQWFDRATWFAVSARLHVSPWAATGLVTIALALVVLVPTTRLAPASLGFAPRQIVQAIAWAVATWILYQIGCALGRAWLGAGEPTSPDPFGDVVGTYAEELSYRVIALGGAAVMFARWRRPVLAAIVLSTLLFAIAHLPRAIVTGVIDDPTYFPVIAAYGALLALVYLATGNVLLAAFLHAQADGPIVLVTCPHDLELAAAINWCVCAAIVYWYSRNSSRTPADAAERP